MKAWASIKTAAVYADVSPRTVRSWLKEGLKHSRLPSGTIRIKLEDLDEFLSQYAVDGNEARARVDGIVEEVMRGL